MNDFKINSIILEWQPIESSLEMTLSTFHRDIIGSFLSKGNLKSDRLELSLSIYIKQRHAFCAVEYIQSVQKETQTLHYI